MDNINFSSKYYNNYFEPNITHENLNHKFIISVLSDNIILNGSIIVSH